MVEIYLIQNMINGKVYVGQTRQGVHRRWTLHVSEAKRYKCHHSAIQYAIRKYGEANFKIRTLNQYEDEVEANEIEKFWIVQIFQSYLPKNGYNRTMGGIGMQFPTNEVRKLQSDKMKEAWKQKTRFCKWKKGDPNHPLMDKTVSSEHLIALYEDGLSGRQIARHLSITPQMVYERLWSIGYKLRTRSQAKRCRDDF